MLKTSIFAQFCHLIIWPNIRQTGRNFRPNISADLAENFGRIFGFGRTLGTLLSNMHSIIATAIWNIRFWFGSPCSTNSQEFYIAAYYTNGNYFSHKSIAYLVTLFYETDGDGISRPMNHAAQAHARFFLWLASTEIPASTILSIYKMKDNF